MRRVAAITVGLLLALLAAIGGIWLWLFGTMPPVEGRVRLSGLKAPVTVARDDLGIPHITADSEEDAYFALGFVHAQDRLWQMEIQRRLGAGRLAEVVGEKALPTDKFMRTLGVYRLAEQSFSTLKLFNVKAGRATRPGGLCPRRERLCRRSFGHLAA